MEETLRIYGKHADLSLCVKNQREEVRMLWLFLLNGNSLESQALIK
jgi:hypothetical protein